MGVSTHDSGQVHSGGGTHSATRLSSSVVARGFGGGPCRQTL